MNKLRPFIFSVHAYIFIPSFTALLMHLSAIVPDVPKLAVDFYFHVEVPVSKSEAAGVYVLNAYSDAVSYQYQQTAILQSHKGSVRQKFVDYASR